jgi:agmatinase
VDHIEVRQAWERAARRAAASGGASRAAPSELPELYPGVPTFMETPLATGPAELVGADVAVLGIPLHSNIDSGVGRGPAALRRQSRRYSLPRGLAHLPGGEGELIDLERLKIVDHGDVAVDGSAIETTYLRVHEKLADILAAGAVPLVLGGDHSVPIPVLQVLSAKLSGKLGIVTFDSLFDLAFAPKYAAGSQWARAFELGVVEPSAFVQIGICGGRRPLLERAVVDELGSTFFTVADVEEMGIAAVAQEALELATTGTEALYVSLDLAVLDAAAGGEARREPAGLSARELLRALDVVSRGRVAGVDICGLDPGLDRDGRLGRVAVRAAAGVLAGLSAQKSGNLPASPA